MSAGARALALGLLLAGAAQAANDAAFVSQSVPIAMAPSQVYAVSVTFHNTGTTTWTPGSLHRLGTQNPQDNTLWTGSTRVMLPPGTSVAPGASYTFSFNVTAPSTPGTYQFQWKMLQESVEWFGVQSTSVPVTVGGLDTSVHFIHVDHLNTPRLVANSSGTTVWRWDQQEPFGVNVPDENPSSLGAFEFPLRFPGQYADKETNLFYNYSRHYDASTGRYDESDLIGLGGGVNTYGYVGGDPLSNTDPFGLCDFDDLICQAAVGQMPISGLRSPCDQDCFNAFFGISTIAAAGTALSGTPSVPKRFATPGSSPATSVASQTASKVFGQAQLPTRLPAPTAANPGAMTNSVARFTGRWVPIAGFGVLMYNFYALGKCLNQCNPMFCPK